MSKRNASRGAISRARYQRKNPSVTEVAVWKILRNIETYRFRRQYPCGNYILDFYCPAAKLCVEVEEPFHDSERDADRNRWLEEQGIYIVRVPRNLVLEDPDAIIGKIEEVSQKRKPKR